MRHPGIIAEHRGGGLSKENHRLLFGWALECAENIIESCGINPRSKITEVCKQGKEWKDGHIPPGPAMKASRDAHSLARESNDPVQTAVARSLGHALAVAHMADHAAGAALYALKAAGYKGLDQDEIKEWQIQKLKTLPRAVSEPMLEILAEKAKSFKI